MTFPQKRQELYSSFIQTQSLYDTESVLETIVTRMNYPTRILVGIEYYSE